MQDFPTNVTRCLPHCAAELKRDRRNVTAVEAEARFLQPQELPWGSCGLSNLHVPGSKYSGTVALRA